MDTANMNNQVKLDKAISLLTEALSDLNFAAHSVQLKYVDGRENVVYSKFDVEDALSWLKDMRLSD